MRVYIDIRGRYYRFVFYDIITAEGARLTPPSSTLLILLLITLLSTSTLNCPSSTYTNRKFSSSIPLNCPNSIIFYNKILYLYLSHHFHIIDLVSIICDYLNCTIYHIILLPYISVVVLYSFIGHNAKFACANLNLCCN
jgi:hypothetical protein